MGDIKKHIKFIRGKMGEKDLDASKKKLLEDYVAVLEKAEKVMPPEVLGAFGFGCGGALACC